MLSGLRRAAPLGAVRALSTVLLTIGALAALAWGAEFVVDTEVSVWRDHPAYLAAADQPHAGWFRVADWVAGVCLILAGPPVLRLAPVHRQGRLTGLIVILFGAALALRASLPLDCVPSVAGVCPAGDGFTAAHHVNRLLMILLTVKCVIGPVVVSSWWHGRWRTIARAVAAVQVVAGMVVVTDWFEGVGAGGLAARVQAVAATVLFVVGIAYIRTMRPARREELDAGVRVSGGPVTCRD